MELSIEVARQIHSIGVDNWLATTESEKSLPFVKFFEDGFKPSPNELEEGKNPTPMADLVENFIVSRQSVWRLTDSQQAFLLWLNTRGANHVRGKGRMVIVDKETIDQYKLEVLTARKNFDQSKDYGPKFRRMIKILTEEGHLIQDERLKNYYLISPNLVSTSSTAEAKKQRYEARMQMLAKRKEVDLATVTSLIKNKGIGGEEIEPIIPIIQYKLNGLLSYTNIQTIANYCEITVKSEEVVSHKQTSLLKQEVVDYSFNFREGEDLKKSLKLDDLKREILSVPRLSKETRKILENYSTNDYAYLVKTAKLENQATLHKSLTEIGLGRKLKVTVGEILKCH